MIVRKKIQNKRQDFFFDKAKEEGYPARSVYKLKEINKKYQIIRRDNIVLDLGCVPGSWMMYLSQEVGPKGRVIGIDIEDMNTGISITDLGLNDFRMDLVNYMKEKGDFDDVPNGMNAICKKDVSIVNIQSIIAINANNSLRDKSLLKSIQF